MCTVGRSTEISQTVTDLHVSPSSTPLDGTTPLFGVCASACTNYIALHHATMCEIFNRSRTLLVCLEELHRAALWKYTWYWVLTLKSDYLPSPGAEVRQFSDTGLNLGSLPLFFHRFLLASLRLEGHLFSWELTGRRVNQSLCAFFVFSVYFLVPTSALKFNIHNVWGNVSWTHTACIDLKSFSCQVAHFGFVNVNVWKNNLICVPQKIKPADFGHLPMGSPTSRATISSRF